MNMQEKDIFELDSFKSLSEYEKVSVKHQYENYVKMKELGECFDFYWLYNDNTRCLRKSTNQR